MEQKFQMVWEGRPALGHHRVEGGRFKVVIMSSENTTQLLNIKIRET